MPGFLTGRRWPWRRERLTVTVDGQAAAGAAVDPVATVTQTRKLTRLLRVAAAVVAVTAFALLVTSPAVTPLVSASDESVTVEVTGDVLSEQPFTLRAKVQPVPAGPAAASLLVERDGEWRPVQTRPVVDGFAQFTATLWRPEQVKVRLDGSGVTSDPVDVAVKPTGQVVRAPQTLPAAAEVSASPAAPVGDGLAASVSAIPDPVWESMQGRSWRPGCPVGRKDLVLISMNHWGFDGYRHRGRIVVAKRIANQVVAAFDALYRQGYPIRRMLLPDGFGRGRYPGADDYQSMAADNTSGFNCRFVVGREEQKVVSPHAYGLAVDVNPLENPFESAKGVFPDAGWLQVDSGPVVLRDPSDKAVRAFTRQGARWGGAWSRADLHHFEWPVGRRN